MARHIVALLLSLLLLLPSAAAKQPTAPDITSGAASSATNSANLELVGHVGGAVTAAAVRGQYAYIGIGLEFAVIDVSAPAAPRRVGSLLLPNEVRTINLAGQYAVVTVEHVDNSPRQPLRIIDISNPANPTIAGSYDYPYTKIYGLVAVVAVVAERYVYVYAEGGTDPITLRVIDIATPSTPIEVGKYDNLEYFYRSTYANNYLYFVQLTGLLILDVTVPTAPTRVGFVSLSFGQNRSVSDIAVAGNYAYITIDYGGMYIIDVANSSDSQQVYVYSFDDDTSIKRVTAADNYVYVTVGRYDAERNSSYGLVVLDVTQPTNPSEVGFVVLPQDQYTYYLLEVTIEGRYAYIVNGYGGLLIADVGSPSAPVLVGIYGFPDNIRLHVVIGDYLYAVNETGLRVINVAQPAEPKPVASLNLSEVTGSVFNGNYAYISTKSADNDDRDFHIIDISNPSNLLKIGSGSFGGCGAMIFVDHYVYYACGGVGIIDVSDPTAPVQVGYFRDTSASDYRYNLSATNVAVIGNVAYVAGNVDAFHDLLLLDVTNPSAPTKINSISAVRYQQLLAKGAYLYASYRDSYNCRIDIIDTTQPTTPRIVGTYPSCGPIVIDGDYLYTLNLQPHGRPELPFKQQVLDIANPVAPLEVGSYTFPANASPYTLTVGGDYIYVGTSAGLFVLRFARSASRSMSGQVADPNGVPFADVMVQASGSTAATTDATGIYTLTNVLPGTVVLTPTLSGYSFFPPTRIVTLTGTINDQNFTILPRRVSATLRPGTATTLAYTDTQGLRTALDAPKNAITQTVVLVLTPTLVADTKDLAFAKHAFDVAIQRNNRSLPDFAFSAPVAVTLHYSDADVRHVRDESELGLYWWNGTQWQDAGTTCSPPAATTRHVENNLLQVAICRTGRFALLGPAAPAPTGLALTGQVTAANGLPVQGVTLATNAGRQTTTNASGVYSFTNVLSGTYTLTPTLAGFTFTPLTRTVTISATVTDQAFTVLPQPVSTTLTLSTTATLVYTDTQNMGVTLNLSIGAVTQTTQVMLTPLMATSPLSQTFTGHAFEFAAMRDSDPAAPFIFNAPISVTIRYSAADVRFIRDESELALYRWTGSTWTDAGQSCSPSPAMVREPENNLVRGVVCETGRYALFGPTAPNRNQVYLPFVRR